MINSAPYTLDLKNVDIDFDKKSYIKIFEKEIITQMVLNDNSWTTGEDSTDKPGLLWKNSMNPTPNGRSGFVTPNDSTPPVISIPVGNNGTAQSEVTYKQPDDPSSFKDNSRYIRNMSQKKLMGSMGGADDVIHVTDES